MPWHDVPAFLVELAQRNGTAAKALAFVILTASRSGEVRGATWGEVDLAGATWTVPSSRTKTAKEYRIPLAKPALDLLDEMKALTGAENTALVFPGASGAKPLSDVALSKLVPSGATTHGFRSSFRDWAGETTAYPREVIEMALGHRVGDAVEQAYARGDLFQRRRRLMDDWATFCGQVAPASGSVVPIRQGAAGA
jgi:integrase